MAPENPPVPLESILATDELPSRFDGTHRYAEENRALVEMAKTIAAEPGQALQRLAEAAMSLTSADAAGVSVLETLDGAEVFRWRAAAGDFEAHLGDTMPRQTSPCGDVLRTNALMLMRDPARHYASVAALGETPGELLLAPFHRDERAIGTVWVVARPGGKRFDSEDARLLQTLTALAGAANDLFEKLSFGNSSYIDPSG
jgi:transcriptional regulator with GAF, ATPase, and Fis domain